jgi:uncharacterized protein (UPF0335 family)
MSKGKITNLAARLRAVGGTTTITDGGRVTIHVPVEGRLPRESEPIGGNSAGQLKAIIERVERLEEEKKGLAGDIRDVYAEAKAGGFDPKILRRIVRIRAEDPGKRAEEAALLEAYLAALGMEP